MPWARLKKVPKQPETMYFMCNNNILDEDKKLGELVVVEYKSKVKPVVSVCDYGSWFDNMNEPKAVAVDNKIGNIFVADTNNNCVKVFDDSGKIIHKFGNKES